MNPSIRGGTAFTEVCGRNTTESYHSHSMDPSGKIAFKACSLRQCKHFYETVNLIGNYPIGTGYNIL